MFEFLFWVCAITVAYVYVGYPLLAAFIALRPKPVNKRTDHQPRVSILIPAHNEAEVIEATLRNKLALNYPKDKLEIRVVSDASDDGTDDIIQRLAAESAIPIHLHRQEPRQGKTAGINTLVEQANGEILAFADANSHWAPDALAELAANFADASVGYVTGKMVYTQEDGTLVGDGCSAYMRFENWLREKETAIGSIVGVDGGIDAMRKSIYQPLRPDQLPDFVQPMGVVEQGYRVVYEPKALLKEPALADADSEFAMRVRVTLRALWALRDMAHLMNPMNHGRYAIQLVSHKLLRYLAFIPLVILVFVSIVLLNDGVIYALAAIGQLAFYTCAALGHYEPERTDNASAWITVPYYFVLLNLACAKAAIAYWRGDRMVTWTPRKG
ncbi:glycosyltransferase involved in cell wall biosynthesis [Natronocella acetinitrilica]|uniref:Glycosyltransferase involved in cell wall biosynthesis n=1 Tax=Natronocella acetinitrilica TaxID=414046 RepID=A0AAE3G7D2_9GAMM|nr:glycosyltransferase involved in cell wall biosynthesis [Natronocella acetinitrilica]